MGFNVSYHLTDVPSILSGDRLLILDPLLRYTEKRGASEGRPGLMLRPSASELEHFRDQLEPYKCIAKDLGLVCKGPLHGGALFRGRLPRPGCHLQ